MTTFNSALFVINETFADEYVKQHMTPLEVTKALAKAGLLMPDGATTQTETVGIYFPEDEEMPDLPDGTDVTRIVGPWEEA